MFEAKQTMTLLSVFTQSDVLFQLRARAISETTTQTLTAFRVSIPIEEQGCIYIVLASQCGSCVLVPVSHQEPMSVADIWSPASSQVQRQVSLSSLFTPAIDTTDTLVYTAAFAE